jgi:hypothetical protein
MALKVEFDGLAIQAAHLSVAVFYERLHPRCDGSETVDA